MPSRGNNQHTNYCPDCIGYNIAPKKPMAQYQRPQGCVSNVIDPCCIIKLTKFNEKTNRQANQSHLLIAEPDQQHFNQKEHHNCIQHITYN